MKVLENFRIDTFRTDTKFAYSIIKSFYTSQTYECSLRKNKIEELIVDEIWVLFNNRKGHELFQYPSEVSRVRFDLHGFKIGRCENFVVDTKPGHILSDGSYFLCVMSSVRPSAVHFFQPPN